MKSSFLQGRMYVRVSGLLRAVKIFMKKGFCLGCLSGRGSPPPQMPSFPPKKIFLSLQKMNNYIG